jgi:histidine triad (HIT) family protein
VSDDCIFCKIVSGEIGSDIAYENDQVMAFNDISPKAPTHILVVPKTHIPTVADLTEDHQSLIAHLILTANKIAADAGLTGYRLVVNCNAEGGQEVYHLHLHIMGGRQMRWPPG